MTQPEAVFFDCDGTLVDSEVICSRAYVHMFQEFGITLDLAEIFKRFKGVKLYEIIDTINAEYGVNLQKATLEPIYRAEVARLFDSELEVIPGAQALLDAVSVPMCVVSNGPVSKMQHSLGRTGLLRHFTDRLYSGYDIQRWKPDPALMFHAAGMEVFYFCADPHNQPIDHPKVTTFTDLAELPALWQARGWNITR